jgi:uncharacterized protein (TIGR02300 family)
MPKPEWGAKRTCASCGARFYDLNHDPIACPECGAAYEVEALVRPKRARAAPRSEGVKKVVVLDDVELPEVAEDEDDDAVLADVEDDDEEGVVAPAAAVEEDDALEPDDAVLLEEDDDAVEVEPLEGFGDEEDDDRR